MYFRDEGFRRRSRSDHVERYRRRLFSYFLIEFFNHLSPIVRANNVALGNIIGTYPSLLLSK